MKTYGSLTYIRDKKKVRFVISKRNTTFGSDENNDFRLKKPMVGQLKLAVRQSARNFVYTLNVSTENESVLINDQKVDPNTDIPLKNSDLISFRGLKFRLNAKSPPRKSFKSLMFTFAGPSMSTRSKIKSIKTRRSSINKWNIEMLNNPLIDLNDNNEEGKKEIDPRESLSMATQFMTAHSIQIEEETTLENLTKTTDTIVKDDTAFVTAVNLNVSADQTLQEKEENPKVIENKQTNIDIHNDTFEVDPIESKLGPKTPPFLQVLTPKSNLKQKNSIQSPMNQSFTPKSVVFNEVVEEHRTQYDKRTGKLFSSQKISKKLFFDSNNVDFDLKDDELGEFLKPSKQQIKATPAMVKKSTPTMAWTRIPVLMPTRVYSPCSKNVVKIGQEIKICSGTSTPDKINIVTDCLIKETPKISIENRSKSKINDLTPKLITETPVKPKTLVVEDEKLVETSKQNVSIVDLESSIDESQDSDKTQVTAIEKSVCSDKINEENGPDLADSVVVVDENDISVKQNTNIDTSLANKDNSKDHDGEEEQVGEKSQIFDIENSIISKPDDGNEDKEEEIGEKSEVFDIENSKTSKSDDDQDSELFVSFVTDNNVEEGSSIDKESEDSVDVSIAEEPKPSQELETLSADYDSNVDHGIKKLQQPKTPQADYESNVDYGIKKLQQPKTPVADYETNVDYGVKKLQQPKTPLADYETNVDYAIKKLQQSKTPKADYETNVDYGIKKLQQSRTPKADYETNVDFGLKKLQQPKTPLADYESVIDFGLKKLQEIPIEPEYDGNLSLVAELFEQFETEDEDQEQNISQIKRTRGKRTKAVATISTPVNENKEQFRRITRSARKAQIKVEVKIDLIEEPVETVCKAEENNKKPARKLRRAKVEQDEIGLLLDCNDDSRKPELDIKKLTEKLANAEESEEAQLESASRSSRTRRARAGGNQSKKTSSSKLRLDDVFEMNDDEMMDFSETKPASKKTSANAGRKRKTVKDCEDGKTIEAKKTRGRGRKKQPTVDADIECDQSSAINGQNKENKKNSANMKAVRTPSKIILPESDYQMRLTNNVQQVLDRFNSQDEDEDEDFENDCTTIKTRLRGRPRLTKHI